MNKLDVKDSKDGHTITFKTTVDEIHNGKNNKGNEGERSFYIDYVIHMPSGNRLEIENSFGKTEIGDFKGLVSLTSKFGSLNTGKLDNVDLIDVEFGKAFITEVNNGRIIFKYNDQSRIGKVNGDVKITSEFSGNVQFNVADNIKELNLVRILLHGPHGSRKKPVSRHRRPHQLWQLPQRKQLQHQREQGIG